MRGVFVSALSDSYVRDVTKPEAQSTPSFQFVHIYMYTDMHVLYLA